MSRFTQHSTVRSTTMAELKSAMGVVKLAAARVALRNFLDDAGWAGPYEARGDGHSLYAVDGEYDTPLVRVLHLRHRIA